MILHKKWNTKSVIIVTSEVAILQVLHSFLTARITRWELSIENFIPVLQRNCRVMLGLDLLAALESTQSIARVLFIVGKCTQKIVWNNNLTPGWSIQETILTTFQTPFSQYSAIPPCLHIFILDVHVVDTLPTTTLHFLVNQRTPNESDLLIEYNFPLNKMSSVSLSNTALTIHSCDQLFR